MANSDCNIWIAAGDGDLPAVRAYVAGGAAVSGGDTSGYTPAHAAASYGRFDVLGWLLANGADATARDEDGDTPLHACESAACADLLVKAGASLTAENAEGLTPYALAVEDRRSEMLAWFRATYAERGMTLPQVEPPADDDGDGDDDVDGDACVDAAPGGGAGGAGDDAGDESLDEPEGADEPAAKRARQ